MMLIGGCLMLSSISAQEWNQKSNMPGNGRDHPVGFAINDTGYILTGLLYEGQNPRILDDFYRYIPENDQWVTMDPFPGPSRGFSIGIAHQGKGYIGFGTGFSGTLNDLWEYDPNSNEWTELPECPCAGRRHPAMEAANGKIYVGLGDTIKDRNIIDLKDWWAYDIENKTWQQIPDLPGPARHHPYHFTLNGNIYAGMGHGHPQGGSKIYRDWYQYDPQNSSWISMNDFPGQGRVAGTQFAHGGKGYVLSGDGDNHGFMQTGQFWSYQPAEDEWNEEPPHPGVSRWAPTNFVANDQVFMMGGLNRKTDQRKDDLWAFNLSSTTSKKAVKADQKAFKIYPNPAKQKVHFPDDFSPQKVELVNTNGQILKSESSNLNSVKVADLSSGLYLLRAKDEKGNWHQSRFLKR